MKNFNAALQQHLAQPLSELAMCIKITRRDGVVLGFTNHDESVIYDGVEYKANAGFEPSAMRASATTTADYFDVETVLSSDDITESDLRKGLYDFAEVELLQLSYAAPQHGAIYIKRGWIGEVSYSKRYFTAEMRGLLDRMSHTMGDLYLPTCRAQLGDNACGTDLLTHSFDAIITDVTDARRSFFAPALTQDDGYFTHGVVEFKSGTNQGLKSEIASFISGQVTLMLPTPQNITPDDMITISAGCDKRFSTCKERFNNALNFRGFPDIPGTDKIMAVAGRKA